MLNHKKIAIAGLVLLASAAINPALADGQTNAGNDNTVCSGSLTDAQQLQCWQDQTILLSAKLKALKEAKRVDGETGGGVVSDSAREITVPNVELIYGTSAKTMSAVLVYSDGRSLTVHPGESVPGNFSVQNITSNPPSVTLDHNGAPLILLMGGGGSSLQSSPNNGLSADTIGASAMAQGQAPDPQPIGGGFVPQN